MIRTTARLMLVALSVVGLLLVLNTGPRAPITAHATQPDTYTVSAASAAIDTRNYDSGNPLDPAPAANTAIPLTSITADQSPSTNAHAAYVEPPGVAEAATQLNNVPVPYPTQANALCVGCAAPVVHDADGQMSQDIDGGRVAVSAGRAHAEADQYVALAQASNGRQSVGPLDQATQFYDAIISDIYNSAALNGHPLPPMPCAPAPTELPGITSSGQACTATLPEVGVLAQASASLSRTTVTTNATGTAVDTTADLQDVSLLDGLISIGSIVTAVHSSGDGTEAHTAIQANTTIQQVCILGDCKDYSITANGICQNAGAVCNEDPINDMLRTEGFNVCRLNTGSTHSGTTSTGSAEGIVVEWHAKSDGGSNYTVDPDYYKTFGGACEPAAANPHAGFYGLSSYAILGESSAQEQTETFPACLSCNSTGTAVTVPGTDAVPPVPGSSSTTITNNVAIPGQIRPGQQVLVGSGAALEGLKDRRGLLLAVFGLLELIMLSNLTAMAMARRAAS